MGQVGQQVWPTLILDQHSFWHENLCVVIKIVSYTKIAYSQIIEVAIL